MRNRVTPEGEIVDVALRGAWTGNRGILHEGTEIVRFHAHDLWIICELDFRGRWAQQWIPHNFTWLYFYDEAVALAAGHRPCGQCRYHSYQAYRTAWAQELGGEKPSAKEMNRRLHGERIVRGSHRRRTHDLPWTSLPDGVFVRTGEGGDVPALVLGGELVAFDAATGYGERIRRPKRGTATVITPPASIAVLTAGYPVQIGAATPHRS